MKLPVFTYWNFKFACTSAFTIFTTPIWCIVFSILTFIRFQDLNVLTNIQFNSSYIVHFHMFSMPQIHILVWSCVKNVICNFKLITSLSRPHFRCLQHMSAHHMTCQYILSYMICMCFRHQNVITGCQISCNHILKSQHHFHFCTFGACNIYLHII